MQVSQLSLPEILLIEPKVFVDPRGHFYEMYQASRYEQYGIPAGFVQDNISWSTKGVVRGLHYQLRQPQGKLVLVLQGEVFDVVVDIRRGSDNFGKWVGVTLSSDNYRQLYIPPGFAHGFCVTSDAALFLYKCTDYYNPGDEFGICWHDPAINITWPLTEASVSDKDRSYLRLNEVPPENLPAL
jgi:dTDP-4-dehydrorhamnose 3,5-epimerase